MTKKHFLLLLAFLFATQNLSSKGVTFHIYQNCNGIRTHLGTANTNPDFIVTFTECINICSDCDIEISHETISGVPLNISDNPNKLSDPNFQYFDLVFGWGNAERTLIEEIIDGNKKIIVKFDLSEIKTSVKFGWMYLDGCRINFNCLNIDHPNNKDNISITDKEICLNDCFYLRDLIKNNDLIDPLTGNTVIKTNPNKDWFKFGDEEVYRGFQASVLDYLYCPTKPGKFEIKTTVKDACGEKEISGFLTVKDCYCDECCELINSYSNKEHNEDINNIFIKCPTAEIKYLDNNLTIISKNFISKYKNNPYTISIPSCNNCGFSIPAYEVDCEKCCEEWDNFNKNFTYSNGLIVVPENLLNCGTVQFIYSDGTILNTNKGFSNLFNSKLVSICFNSRNCLKCSHCIEIK